MSLLLIIFLKFALLGKINNMPPRLCIKIGAPESQQKYVRFAAAVSKNSKYFLALLEGENEQWSPYRQSDVRSKITGKREPSFGFCQIDADYHPEILRDPRFLNPYWQIQKCHELYLSGTKMYADRHIVRNAKHFNCN